MGSKLIVVGVDGSDGSKAALHWALDEADRRGDQVEAVMVWDPVPLHTAGIGAGVVSEATYEAIERASRDCLDKVVTDATTTRADKLEVHQRVICGSPSVMLIEAARGADLLVVGARGIGGLTRMLLGSVASQVVTHAEIPVVVVPREHERA